MASDKTVKVYEVLADGPGDGLMGDGTHVNRFRKLADANAFAATATCRSEAATVEPREASATLLRRWQREGKIR